MIFFTEDKRSGIHFETVKDFFNQCIDYNYGDLEAVLETTGPSNESQKTAWRDSLKHMAGLLANPYATCVESIEDVRNKCDLMLPKTSSEILDTIINSEYLPFITAEEKDELVNINQKLFESIKERSEKTIEALTEDSKLKETTASLCFEDDTIDIYLEHPFGKKRADMIVKKGDRWAVIEFKGWNEWFIDEEKKDPIEQVETYVDLIKKEDKRRRVRGYVYLHNQIFEGGKLYENIKRGQDHALLYSRHRCDRFLINLHKYLTED